MPLYINMGLNRRQMKSSRLPHKNAITTTYPEEGRRARISSRWGRLRWHLLSY
ncbi:hypothetical protein [Escherichia coli]|uniref:hypothetical protein n=1 Tax=Escherichia coli TaxID=562 RepID=UPI00388E2454